MPVTKARILDFFRDICSGLPLGLGSRVRVTHESGRNPNVTPSFHAWDADHVLTALRLPDCLCGNDKVVHKKKEIHTALMKMFSKPKIAAFKSNCLVEFTAFSRHTLCFYQPLFGIKISANYKFSKNVCAFINVFAFHSHLAWWVLQVV